MDDAIAGCGPTVRQPGRPSAGGAGRRQNRHCHPHRSVAGSRGAIEPMSQTVSGRLKIGLSACFSHADPARSLFTNKTLQYVEQSITHWLMSAGAMVVMVPCPTGATARGDTKLSHYAEWLDGVVMHGGADVWPGSYGEVPLKDAWVGDRIRDLYDLALVEAFEQAGKPIFGVCRGLQLINVAFGGTLYQ